MTENERLQHLILNFLLQRSCPTLAAVPVGVLVDLARQVGEGELDVDSSGENEWLKHKLIWGVSQKIAYCRQKGNSATRYRGRGGLDGDSNPVCLKGNAIVLAGPQS